MNNYFDSLNNEIKSYFKILSSDFPSWLNDYINTPEMKRIGTISMSCGTDYSGIYNLKYFYSNLDHSIGTSLITWHFTHDKKATLASLFHDIATPVFKHCIDFMNGDSVKQESTEERTLMILKSSKDIMKLLERDNIKLEEVYDYKMYPIADNDLPKLSADRLEYTFSSGLTFFRIWSLDKIEKMYNNLIIVKNEDGIDELAFKDKGVATEYIDIINKIWYKWTEDQDRCVMQFLADICNSSINHNYLTIDDLYKLSEKEVIDIIKNKSDDYLKDKFICFEKAKKVNKSNTFVKNKYCVSVTAKARYINPLVKIENNVFRVSDISRKASSKINDFLNTPKGEGYYVYFDFDFKPYTKKII